MNGVFQDIHLEAKVARVWEYLTDPTKLAEWLMVSNLNPENGAKLGTHFAFSSEPMGTWDGKIVCEVTQIIKHELLSFTWNANDIGAETLVTFKLNEEAGGTRLRLTHTQLEDAMPGSEGRHAAGWASALNSLKVILAGSSQDFDWSEFQITFFVEAPLAKVYSIWSTADGLRRFWPDEIVCTAADGGIRGPTDIVQRGDCINLTYPTHGSSHLEIINIEANKFVTFTFGLDYGWVNVGLSEEGGCTKIVLRQFGFPTEGEAAWEIHVNARGWWISNLMNMKSVLLYGKDLRVREAGVESGLGALYQPADKTVEQIHDWTQFDIYLYIDAPTSEVLDRWRSAAGLESFFIGQATFTDASSDEPKSRDLITTDDTYVWNFIHNFELKGSIHEVSEERIAFTFGANYLVEITAKAHNKGTLLRLHQHGMQDDPQDRVSGTLNCRSCWIYFLINLKSQLEFGIDLRNQNPETADSVAVNYVP